MCNYSSNPFSIILKTILLGILFLCIGQSLHAADPYYFFLSFTDKKNTPYSLENPEDFLSIKSIQRRLEQNLVCDSTDLPVDPNYVSQVSNINGVDVHSTSKWMNGAIVLVADSSLMTNIRQLPFIKSAEYTGRKLNPKYAPASKIKKFIEDYGYGESQSQTDLVKGAQLHNLGYTGAGISIALLDAGFTNVNTNPGFDSLRMQNRLLGALSVVDKNENVYNAHVHGANVLSIMAGNYPDSFVGSAPHASYWLIQTEVELGEYKVEVDFLTKGLEYADSVGVDVVNISLGYFEFDDDDLSFTYADMNGQTSRGSRAANLAANKGMIVCASAGNEGSRPWKYICSPADAEGVLTVGAVNNSGTIAAFSSWGPSSDNRIKPDVCATGQATAYVDIWGDVENGNGTSYSSPVMAGFTACYLQYCKEHIPNQYSVRSIINQIISSADRYSDPDEQYGYGIPDFEIVLNNTSPNSVLHQHINHSTGIKFLPQSKELQIDIDASQAHLSHQIKIYTAYGDLLYHETHQASCHINLAQYAAGMHIVYLSVDGRSSTFKILIQ